MPFIAQRLDVVPDDGSPTHSTFRSASLSAFGLAVDAPCISVLFDMCHAVLKRVTALGAEEMAKVPMVAKSNDMFAKNWGSAMFATRRKELVPIEVTEEAETIIAVLVLSLPWDFWESLPSLSSANAVQSLRPHLVRFMTDLHGLQTGATGIAPETLRMKSFRRTTQSDKPSFNWEATLVADGVDSGGCSGSRRPVTARTLSSTCALTRCSRSWKWTWAAGGIVVVRGYDNGNIVIARGVINGNCGHIDGRYPRGVVDSSYAD